MTKTINTSDRAALKEIMDEIVYCAKSGQEILLTVTDPKANYNKTRKTLINYGLKEGGKRKTLNAYDFGDEGHTWQPITLYAKDRVEYKGRKVYRWEAVPSREPNVFAASSYWDSEKYAPRTSRYSRFSPRDLEISWEPYARVEITNRLIEQLSAEATDKTAKEYEKADKAYADEQEFFAARPKTVKAPFINAGCCVPYGVIGNPDDFIDWYCCGAYSAEMADSYSVTSAERRDISIAAEKIIEEFGWTSEELSAAQARFIDAHPDGGYCTFCK